MRYSERTEGFPVRPAAADSVKLGRVVPPPLHRLEERREIDFSACPLAERFPFKGELRG